MRGWCVAAGASALPVGSLGNSSPSPAEVGSFGSFIHKGSYMDRFARDREAAQPPFSSGLSFTGRLAPSSKPGHADVFAKILPQRWAQWLPGSELHAWHGSCCSCCCCWRCLTDRACIALQ